MGQQTYRFCEFELDVTSQTLSHRGVRAKFQKQPFQVLELLVQRAPEIVSREEIRRHVWGNAVYIDATQSINFCIRQIRVALGDTSAGSRFIETLPRQGYRFIATLDEIPGNTGISEPVPVQESRPGIGIPRWLIPGFALVALVLVIGVCVRLGKRETTSGVAGIRPVTTFPGDEREPALSPDGRQVAFSWGGKTGDNRDIYVMLLGEQDPLRLTFDSAEDAYPAWSPDGNGLVPRFETNS